MKDLCQKIHMPEEVTQILLSIHSDPGFQPELTKLFSESTWEEGRRELKDALGADPKGFRELCCMLRCALAAKPEFHALGFPESVYYDTMGCFSRFVREHRESYGCYGFDRGFWTVRQISCRLFRIGQLEYELAALDGKPAISLHIPTDVRLELPLLRSSYLEARNLINAAFPEYRDAPVFCDSWLLSPTLEALLPENSRILQFQRSFRRTSLSDTAQGYVQWVFKNPRLTVAQYPEDTSLQRKLKAFLLEGGTFVSAKGILTGDPFV